MIPVLNNYRGKSGEETEGKEVQWPTQIGIQFKRMLQGLTLLLMLRYAYTQEPRMAVLQEAQQAAETYKDVYIQLMD